MAQAIQNYLVKSEHVWNVMSSSVMLYAVLLSMGAIIVLSNSPLYRQLKVRRFQSKSALLPLQALASLIFTFILVFIMTRSVSISTSIAIIVGSLPTIYKKDKRRKEAEARRKSWPLVIDQLATATSSGVSMHTAMIQIVERGPKSLREEFTAFKESFVSEGSVEKALVKFVESSRERGSSAHALRASQLKSTLLIARDYGGQEVGTILRNLSAHLRKQEAAFDEIAIRQDWIKNSAILASITPWILLLIIALNSKSLSTYNSNAGKVVLLLGLIITALAYKWIRKIANSVFPQEKFN